MRKKTVYISDDDLVFDSILECIEHENIYRIPTGCYIFDGDMYCLAKGGDTCANPQHIYEFSSYIVLTPNCNSDEYTDWENEWGFTLPMCNAGIYKYDIHDYNWVRIADWNDSGYEWSFD